MPRPPHWGLYLISDIDLLRAGTFCPFLAKALQAGLRVVQLRGKDLPDDLQIETGREIRDLTRRHGADFIVNDRLDLALELDADGLHIGQDDLSPAQARAALGPDRYLGLSTHSREQIEQARHEPVDYIGVGPAFPTSTKENADPVVGVDLIQWAVRHAAQPVVAIGGIDLANVDSLLCAGAENVAVISAISRSADPSAATRQFLSKIEGAGREQS
ncbi:thiamine phosphate synthase [bacterium]|nr:thiamine phosphate synthase [bacterium]